MAGFVLRREGDTENPKLVRVFGEQTTSGQLCYFNKIGNQTAFIVFLGEGEKYGEGEFGGIVWFKYAGFPLVPYDLASGVGDYILHTGKESTGFADPNQGRPTFFPQLDFTFSGKVYAEVKLPVALSDDTGEPTNSQIRVRGSCINDYDAAGAVIGGNYGPSANNLREFIYCCKLARKLTPANIVSRVDWPSWVDARAKCDAALSWAGGGGDGLVGDYYSDDSLTTVAFSRTDGQINFAFGVNDPNVPAVPFSVRWTGYVEAPVTGTYIFTAQYDDGIRVWIDGTLIIDDWTVGPTRESTGSIALTIGSHYTIKVEYLNAVLRGSASLSYECGSGLQKQIIPRDRLFTTAGVISAGRTAKRYEGDLVFPGTPLPSALTAIMSKCPGIEWQEVNGKIRFLSDPNRASVFTFYYDPTQTVTPANIASKSFIGKPRDPMTTPNFFQIGFRDKDDEQLTQKYVPIDRPDRRDQLNGQLVDAGIVQIGVATQSLAERVGEAGMRLSTDLDLDVVVKGQKGAHKVAKADRVTLVHTVGDWRGTAFAGHSGPIDMLVQDETFESTIETANEKTFSLREYDPNYYSDSDHGPLLRKRITDIESPFGYPPVVASLVLVQSTTTLDNGRPSITIEGMVQAATWSFEQRLRIWHQRPNDYISGFDLSVSTGANLFTTVAPHNFGDNQPIEFKSLGGTIPAPLAADTIYYVLVASPTEFNLSLKPDGAVLDISSAGAGSWVVAPYFPSDRLLTPNSATLQASFELPEVEVGVHKVIAVSESRLQQHFAIGVHPVESINVSVPALITPQNLVGVYDEVDGDLLAAWETAQPKLKGFDQIFEIDIRNSAGTASMRPPMSFTPAMNEQLQEYVIWNPTAVIGAGGGSAALTPFGGINIEGQAEVTSKVGAEVIGGLLVEFQAPSMPSNTTWQYMPDYWSIFPEWSYGFSGDYAFLWQARQLPSDGYNWYAYPEGYSGGEHDAFRQKIVAGNRYGIYIRPDGIAEYYVNIGMISRPVYTSGRPVDRTARYKTFIKCVGGTGQVVQVTWQRYGPEWKYMASAQRKDFGLTISDPLPASIRFRVRQVSPFATGTPSAWLEQVFVRP